MLGCTNPAAVNYNPAATENDGSCIYLVKVGEDCHQFEEADPVDYSFTLSYEVSEDKWSFYHDYYPNYYFHTRNKIYNLLGKRIYEMNAGPRGVYHGNSTPYPFFFDAVFSGNESLVLNSVIWNSEVQSGGNTVADDDMPSLYNETITAITVWNNYQCTGRIDLKEKTPLLESNNRNSELTWSFNDFRDIVKTQGAKFLDSLFENFKVTESAIDRNLPWYNKRLIEGMYFIVRFEFNNLNDKQITMYNVDLNASKSFR